VQLAACAACRLLECRAVLIRIARAVRVTLSDTELQMLRPGEFYDVPPAVGLVLISEGWAESPSADAAEEWPDRETATDRAARRPRTS
jgi:hypothetical protein